MSDDFTELKRLFDLEVESIKEKTEVIPAELGGGDHLAPSAIVVKLLDGYSLKEGNAIIRSAFFIIDRLNSRKFKINAVEVENVL